MHISSKYTPLIVIGVLAALVALLLPAVQHARPDAVQRNSINNVHMLLLAMQHYEYRFKSFPPAYVERLEGNVSRPLLSWRVLILPIIEEQRLYNEFHLDEPWDSPHNLKLVPRMPRVYQSPRRNRGEPDGQGTTPYLALRGARTALSGPIPTRVSEVSDGLSNTVVIAEVLPEYEVIWTRPDDLDVTADGITSRLQVFRDCVTVGRLDGSVWCPGRETSDELFRQWGDIRDGGPFEHRPSAAERELQEYLSRPSD